MRLEFESSLLLVNTPMKYEANPSFQRTANGDR